jgi:large-conductance mechanosensitive channel
MSNETIGDKRDKTIIENTVEKNVEKDLEDIDNFGLNDIVVIFSVVGITIGNTMGFSIDKLLSSVTDNILHPVLNALYGNKLDWLTPQINGERIYLNKFINQLVTFSITSLLIYLIMRYALKSIVKDTMKYQRTSSTRQNRQNIEIIKNLNDINKNIINMNKHKHKMQNYSPLHG